MIARVRRYNNYYALTITTIYQIKKTQLSKLQFWGNFPNVSLYFPPQMSGPRPPEAPGVPRRALGETILLYI